MSAERATLTAIGVHHSFGSVRAVVDVDLVVSPGDVIGLVGLNGAGKTTTLSILSGVLKPDRGRVLVGDADPWGDTVESRSARGTIGFMPDSFPVYGRMTGWDYLDFVTLLRNMTLDRGRERAAELAAGVGLTPEVLDRTTSTYSTGMKRKLMLLASDLHEPRLLLLDEPTSGLDPEAQKRFRGWIVECRTRGAGVLLSSHSLDLVADCCTAVAIMHQGRMVAGGTLSDLAARYGLEESEAEGVFFAAIGERGRLDRSPIEPR